MRRNLLALCAAIAMAAAPRPAERLVVCATVPSLGAIVSEIGGDEVDVTVFAKGTENPHFVDARPSFVKTLASADLFLLQGLDLETGWAPVLLQQARNGRVLPGAPGHLDCSIAVERLEVPATPIDRSHGDVHPSGNPHYMTDPVNGIRVARLIRDRLSELRPAAAAGFDARCTAFENRLCAALVGEKLASGFGPDTVLRLAKLHETGGLARFLEEQGRLGDLSGWLGAMLPFHGTRVLTDHVLWSYFDRRFGIVCAGTLEPKPGISPTTKHLAELIRRAPGDGVRLVITSPGFDRKSAELVAQRIGVPLLTLAHEVGATEGATSYLAMIDANVRAIVAALARP